MVGTILSSMGVDCLILRSILPMPLVTLIRNIVGRVASMLVLSDERAGAEIEIHML